MEDVEDEEVFEGVIPLGREALSREKLGAR